MIDLGVFSLFRGGICSLLCLNYLYSHHKQLTRAHLLPISVFALGIVAESPQRSEDLEWIARPEGERPNSEKVKLLCLILLKALNMLLN